MLLTKTQQDNGKVDDEHTGKGESAGKREREKKRERERQTDKQTETDRERERAREKEKETVVNLHQLFKKWMKFDKKQSLSNK